MAVISKSQQYYDKIQKLINSSRFNESFLLLKNGLQKFPVLKKELENLNSAESTYRYMLDYLAEGHSDPSRDEVINRLKYQLNHANDTLLRETRLVDNPDIYSSTRRMEVLRNNTFKNKLDNFLFSLQEDGKQDSFSISALQGKALDELFNYVWTLGFSSPQEYQAISGALDSPELPEYVKVLIISALTLGNIEYFVPEAYDILLNQLDSSESTLIKARSVVALALISLLHSQRIEGNLDLKSRLILSSGDEDRKKLLKEVFFDIVRTYDTQRIDKKMRDEVIPGLMKIKPEILDKMRNLASDSENFLSDANPDWEELIENSDIGDKLREINDLQMEGADVMVTAFSNLKSFSFFNSVSNWFMPFMPGNFEFANLQLDNEEETVDRLTTVMCDSDLHSFLLSLKNLPETNRSQMLHNIENQMKEAKEAMAGAIGETQEFRLAKKIRHSLQDLYRFFKFFRKKNDFIDPFATPFSAKHLHPLMKILDIDTDTVRIIAEFYFKNKYYKEAAELFELIDQEISDFRLWEKIGYSYDRLRDFEKAVNWYRKAELVNPDNAWLVKKLAIALKNSGNPGDALEYYEKALESEPENFHLIMSAAQCLLHMGEYDKALKHFYHAQYLKPEKLDVLRAIAWAQLLGKNFDKAEENYRKILSSVEVDKTDFLNAAHAALANGDFQNALKLYKEFVTKSENQDTTALVLAFKEDSDLLKKLGIKTSDLRLIVDKIRYDIYSPET